MLSRTSEYALRAVLYLAGHGTVGPIPSERIATEAGVPHKYLSRILADLARCGVLAACRGRRGGFRMARPPGAVSLHQVIEPFQRADRSKTAEGREPRGAEERTATVEEWDRAAACIREFLLRTTIGDVSPAAPSPAAPSVGMRLKRGGEHQVASGS